MPFIEILRRLVPQPWRRVGGEVVRRLGRRFQNAGWRRYCPLCSSHLAGFLSAGVRNRPEARCPVCGSFERHRLAWLYMRTETDLLDGRPKSILHVSPEKLMAQKLRKLRRVQYVSIDINPARGMVAMDLTSLALPENIFDVVYCSHVLEHIPSDRAAMAEMFRVTKPGGWLLVQVPLGSGSTVEDPNVTDPLERERRFGQDDHVRLYGRDLAVRLRSAGFEVLVDGYVKGLSSAWQKRTGLDIEEDIFLCRKCG